MSNKLSVLFYYCGGGSYSHCVSLITMGTLVNLYFFAVERYHRYKCCLGFGGRGGGGNSGVILVRVCEPVF